MKRLLAEGSGSIYQVCNVFRRDEAGRFHNPEFAMLEWYRLDYDYQQLMDDVSSLMQSVTGNHTEVIKLTYQQAFKQLQINPHSASPEQLENAAGQAGIAFQSSEPLNKDQWLDLLMSHVIEPSFAADKLTFVYDYPASQAALAKVRKDKYPVAERFELYWGGVELANGFTELQDASEQRWRFEQDNKKRIKAGQSPIPMDEKFLVALQKGLPACSGVALGLDRLLMVLSGASSINEAISFPVSDV
jgi:lysyl-tRNA synthetase class 2